MPVDDKATVIDFDKAASALEALAATPNPTALTLMEQIRQPKIFDAIEKAKANGYKTDQIVSVLAESGIVIKPTTLDQYLTEIRKDMRDGEKGDTNAKARSKPKTAKSSRTPSDTATTENKPTAETASRSSGKSADRSADKPSGKPLGNAVNMGGAFSEEI